MRKTLLLFMLCAAPGPLAAQSESFVVRLGTDTIAIETFMRSASRLEGELSGSAVRARSRYALELSNGNPVALRSEVIPAGSDTATLKATMQFARDSVFVQLVRSGIPQPEQRLATKPGAVPFVNLAFSFVELVTTREQRITGDSSTAQLFLLENGATLPAKIKWIAADS